MPVSAILTRTNSPSCFDLHAHASAGGRVLDGVEEHVRDRLFDEHGLALDHVDRRIDLVVQDDGLCSRARFWTRARALRRLCAARIAPSPDRP